MSGLFAAAAFAGPGPQLGSRSAAKPAPKAEAPAAKCEGCKTTPIWAPGDRSPAGKGAFVRVVGTKHECTRAAGIVASEPVKVKDRMTRDVGLSVRCCK
jgi:hypothetical protein